MTLAVDTPVDLYPFVLTEDQEHLRREIREFAAREIAPNVMAWDEASEFPSAAVKKLGASSLHIKTLIEAGQLDHHNVIGVEIRANLWAQPVPIEFLVRTEIDLETGNVQMTDLNSSQVA